MCCRSCSNCNCDISPLVNFEAISMAYISCPDCDHKMTIHYIIIPVGMARRMNFGYSGHIPNLPGMQKIALSNSKTICKNAKRTLLLYRRIFHYDLKLRCLPGPLSMPKPACLHSIFFYIRYLQIE